MDDHTPTRQPRGPKGPRPDSVKIDGPAVRARRLQIGQTLKGVAELTAISYQYVSEIETGKRTHVSYPVYRALVTALRVGNRPSSLVIKAAA